MGAISRGLEINWDKKQFLALYLIPTEAYTSYFARKTLAYES